MTSTGPTAVETRANVIDDAGDADAHESLLQQLIEYNPAVIVVTTWPAGRIIEVNRAFTEATGWSRDEALGHTTVELNLWKGDSNRDAWVAALRQHKVIRAHEVTGIRKDGQTMSGLVSSTLVDIGQRPCIVTTIVDITQRRAAEAALRQSEAKYRGLFETLSDGIFIADGQWRLVDVNCAACRRLGYERDELLGTSFRDLDPLASHHLGRSLPELMGRGVALFPARHRKKSGGALAVELSIALIDYNGTPAFLIVSREMGERGDGLRAELASIERTALGLPKG